MIYSMFRDRNASLLQDLKQGSWGGREMEVEEEKGEKGEGGP